MLINAAFFIMIVALYYLFMKYAFWIVAPFVLAFLIAMILQKPISFVSKKTKIKKGILGAVAVLLIIAIILSALVLVGYRLGVEFRDFAGFVASKFSDIPKLIAAGETWALNFIHFLPDGLEKTAGEAITDFADKLLAAAAEGDMSFADGLESVDLSILATPLGGLWSTAKQIPSILLAAFIGIIACFFITCDYDNYVAIIKGMLTEEHAKSLVKAKTLLYDIIGKMLKSYIMIMFITFCEISIGLNVLKFAKIYTGGYILAISIGIAVLDMLPVFGTGAVMIPWIVFEFFSGNTSLGIGLLVVYSIITVVRQIMEPRLVAMNVGVPPLVTLAGMYIGLRLFGAIGIIIVPVTFILIKALNSEGIIHLWGKSKREKIAAKNGENSEKEESKEESPEAAGDENAEEPAPAVKTKK